MTTNSSLSILFIVQAGNTFGTGHLKRLLLLSQYYTKVHFFVITDLKDSSSLQTLLPNINNTIVNASDINTIVNVLRDNQFDLMVGDCISLPESFIQRINNVPIPLISFDSKQFGKSSEIYIAALPAYNKKTANFHELHYTPINTNYFSEIKDIPMVRKILISLGGSDPKKNTLKLYKALKDSPYQITIVRGPLADFTIEESDNIKVVSQPNNLLTLIEEHDLVICGPGNTMLEVMAAKKYIVVMAHTHQQALDLSTIPSLPVLTGGLFLSHKKIKNAIENAYLGKLSLPENFDYQTWWTELSTSIANRPAYCPLCNSHSKSASFRTEEINQFLCSNCQSSYIYHLKENQSSINDDYIICNNVEQGQQDYKTHVLELREDSNRRIQIIKKILLKSNNYHSSYKMLDIGAKHGIFVQEANHNGFSTQGVELSDFARRHALDNWNITLIDSMDYAYQKGAVNNIVTVWDHLELLSHPLEYLKKLSQLLPLGGLLAFRVKINNNHIFHSGFFRITERGGKLLAERAGFVIAEIARYTEKKQEYLEFYCVKQSEI